MSMNNVELLGKCSIDTISMCNKLLSACLHVAMELFINNYYMDRYD